MSRNTVRCIDWREIIFDLHKAGMTVADIAVGCGFRAPTRAGEDDGGKAWVNRLKNVPDTEPNFHAGAMLLGLWADRMQRPLAEVPRATFRYVRNASGRITALPLVDRLPGESAAAQPAIVADSPRAPR